MSEKKIKTQTDLLSAIEKEKASGKRIGFTNGCFDILHLGHIRYLTRAKEGCDILIIGVNSDGSVKKIKGSSRPINSQQARLEVLASLECVDFLTVFEEETPENLIKALSPDIIFKGGDWKEEDIAGSSHVKSYGGEVSVIPYVEGHSTTSLIEKIQKA